MFLTVVGAFLCLVGFVACFFGRLWMEDATISLSQAMVWHDDTLAKLAESTANLQKALDVYRKLGFAVTDLDDEEELEELKQ